MGRHFYFGNPIVAPLGATIWNAGKVSRAGIAEKYLKSIEFFYESANIFM